MPKSKIKFGNQFLSMTFDGLSGELLELVNMKNSDNLLKNWNPLRNMPFSIKLKTKNGSNVLVQPPNRKNVMKHNTLMPKISIQETNNGIKRILIDYNSFWIEDHLSYISVIYSVTIKPDSCETIWNIEVKNNETNYLIEEVIFPILSGIYLGKSWEDDVLVFPFNAGEKINNPIEAYEKGSSTIGWKWQEYKYLYSIDGIETQKDLDGFFYRQCDYSGPLSMMWLDYFDSEGGLYLSCYDDKFMIGSLRAETLGKKRPGMGFSIIKYPQIKKGDTWKSPSYGLAIHDGDWHWASDSYRKWRNSCKSVKLSIPEWFKRSTALVAHYDFKYQNGDIVHKFKDIPKIYKQAIKMGVDHILISGWHKDGFDNGFPQYTPDPDLGTEEDLKQAVRFIRNLGGHVTFYINSQLCNIKYEDKKELIEECSVINKKGEIETTSYGDESITFSVMCSNADKWEEYLINVVDYLVNIIGADGIYFDQLGMAKPQFCYNEKHNHHIADWNKGYRNLILDCLHTFQNEKGNDPILFLYEGVTDIHGEYISAQLISTFFYYHCGAYPELYKYTFPEQILVDMVYPRKNLSMRPVHIAQVSREMINKAFILGSYFWIYDLEEDNTFKNDPEQYEYLKKVIDLKNVWLNLYGQGIFKDTVGIEVNDNGILAKLYYLNDSSNLITIANAAMKKEGKVKFYCDPSKVKIVTCNYLNEPNYPIELVWIPKEESDKKYIEIVIPNYELALIHIEFYE